MTEYTELICGFCGAAVILVLAYLASLYTKNID